jgi:PAS domain S-box-containing protein
MKRAEDFSAYGMELEALNEELRVLRETVERSRQELNLLYHFAPVAYFTLDSYAVVTRINEAAIKLLGKADRHIQGFPFLEFVVPTDAARFLSHFHTTRRSLEKQHGEIVISALKGPTAVAVESIALTNTDGETEVLSALTDITERRRLEKERQREYTAAARLAVVVESVTESMIITDSSFHIEYINPAFTRYTDYALEEVKGREMRFLRSETHDQKDYDETRQAAKAGRSHSSRYPIRKKDGSELMVETTTSTMKDAEGRITNFVLIWRDISEQVKLEEQLQQAQKMEAIGTLAGGIAHDFNNMLAVIIGNAEIALDDIGDEHATGYNIKQILQASERARDLVKQILTFSRKNASQRKRVELGPLVRETANLLRGSLPSSIDIKIAIPAEAAVIFADPSHVQQVIMNLASNAAHAMRDDGGTLVVRLATRTFADSDTKPDRDMPPGPYVKLTVKDTGTGIPKKNRAKIFDPFFTTKEPGQGTGMGLAVVFGIVKSYEGAITVESEVGKGSTFNVFFPAADIGEGERPEENLSLPTGKERVLLVDDEPSLVLAASETLGRLGYAVTTAANGVEGLKKFENDPYGFDLVITDYMMPKITGLRLAEKILKVRDDIPLILFTGYIETLSPSQLSAAGIRAVLMKPVVKKDLAETVRQVLDNRAAPDNQ